MDVTSFRHPCKRQAMLPSCHRCNIHRPAIYSTARGAAATQQAHQIGLNNPSTRPSVVCAVVQQPVAQVTAVKRKKVPVDPVHNLQHGTQQQPGKDKTSADKEAIPEDRVALLHLQVDSFALIDHQELPFGACLNVVTGESGSGKSVLVESLNQLLGGPAPSECIREPADTASVQGTFWLPQGTAVAVRAILQQEGVTTKALPPAAAGQLLIRREIVRQEASSGGSGGSRAALRSRCFVNNAPVTLRALRALSSLLVDMNGQHSSLALREGSTQLALLDKVAGCGALVAQMNKLISEMSVVEVKLEELDALSDVHERENKRRLVEAVRKVRCTPGEEVTLRRDVRALDASRLMAEQCGAARAALSGDGLGDGGLMGLVRSVETQLRGAIATGHASNKAPQGAPASRAAVGPRARSRARSITPYTKTNGTTITATGTGAVSKSPQRTQAAAGGGSSPGTSSGLPASANGRSKSSGSETDDGDLHAGLGPQTPEESVEEEEEEVGPLDQALDTLGQARQSLSQAEALIRDFMRQSVLDMHEYEEKSERLQTLEKLMRSHRCRTTEELLALSETAQRQLDEYEDMAAHAEDWETDLERLRSELLATACQLSAARRAAAPRLSHHIESCLKDLSMGGARVDVAVMWTAEPNASRLRECEALDVPLALATPLSEQGDTAYRLRPTSGLDLVELRIAAGPAEPLRPLSAVASGGESARVMLALKAAPLAGVSPSSVPAATGPTGPTPHRQPASEVGPAAPVLVLDELDSGIGSRLGASVGALLKRMAGVTDTGSAGSQIICVTHLPQVACYAQHHVKVLKSQGSAGPSAGRVTTQFQVLGTEEERTEEVAAMMGTNRLVAQDLLRVAQGNAASSSTPTLDTQPHTLDTLVGHGGSAEEADLSALGSAGGAWAGSGAPEPSGVLRSCGPQNNAVSWSGGSGRSGAAGAGAGVGMTPLKVIETLSEVQADMALVMSALSTVHSGLGGPGASEGAAEGSGESSMGGLGGGAEAVSGGGVEQGAAEDGLEYGVLDAGLVEWSEAEDGSEQWGLLGVGWDVVGGVYEDACGMESEGSERHDGHLNAGEMI